MTSIEFSIAMIQKWIRICFLNLLIVALLGVALRYKIAFSLPIINQKHLLHGHSHFAFSGWITQILMVLMIHQFSQKSKQDYFKKFNYLLWGNLITAYGMLISFPLQGYGLFSISFSTLSIINAYIFGYQFWKALNKSGLQLNSFLWFKAGILFNIISSFGAFSLAYIMATFTNNQTTYLMSVYGFLHFQYNGWFFFGITGLLIGVMENKIINKGRLQLIFWMFSLSCIPAYLLSTLWLQLPTVLFMLVIIAATGQFVAWILLIIEIRKCKIINTANFKTYAQWLFTLAAISLSIKLLLQLFSTIPMLSQIAFGFRPIVIGYLHLMLLGVITIFTIGYVINAGFIQINKYFTSGLIVFIVGIIVNQLFLMIQGIYAMKYIGVPYINEALLIAASTMFTGMLLLNFGNFKSKYTK